jgi:hypothetical protein
VYVVSGFVEGWFLSGEFGNGIIGGIMGFLVGYATQITRAVIVFFDQLNADRVKFSYASEIIALVFGAFAIASIVGLVLNNGLSVSVAFSLGFLMICGVFLEIKFLKEIRYANRDRLLREGRIPEIAKHAQAMKQLEMQLNMIEAIDEEPTDQDVSAFRQNLLLPSPREENEETRSFYTSKLINNLAIAKLDEVQVANVVDMMNKRMSEKAITMFIEEAKQKPRNSKKEAIPLELEGVNLNGSAPH